MARGCRIVYTASKLGSRPPGCSGALSWSSLGSPVGCRRSFRECFFVGIHFPPFLDSFWGWPDSQNQ